MSDRDQRRPPEPGGTASQRAVDRLVRHLSGAIDAVRRRRETDQRAGVAERLPAVPDAGSAGGAVDPNEAVVGGTGTRTGSDSACATVTTR